jgi:hypothetical protein
MIKTLMHALNALNLTRIQPQSKVSEREERESSRMQNEPFKVPRETSLPLAWSINTPFPWN